MLCPHYSDTGYTNARHILLAQGVYFADMVSKSANYVSEWDSTQAAFWEALSA